MTALARAVSSPVQPWGSEDGLEQLLTVALRGKESHQLISSHPSLPPLLPPPQTVVAMSVSQSCDLCGQPPGSYWLLLEGQHRPVGVSCHLWFLS